MKDEHAFNTAFQEAVAVTSQRKLFWAKAPFAP
jgi:hypothetical protein